MAKDTGDARRLRALLLIAAYALLCGVPVWWRTTSVPRPTLPHGRMRALGGRLVAAAAAAPPSSPAVPAASLPVRLDVHVVAAEDAPSADLAQEVERLVREQRAALPARLDVAVSVWRPSGGGGGGGGGACAQRVGGAGPASSGGAAAAAAAPCLSVGGRLRELLGAPSPSPESSAEIDALLLDALGGGGEAGAGRYALVAVVVPPAPPPPQPQGVAADGAPPLTLTVGQHRHAWVAVPGGAAAAPPIAEAAALALRHAFGLWADDGRPAAAAQGGGGGDGAPPPPDDLASLPLFSPGGLVLSFSLVNGGAAATSPPGAAIPCAGGYAWDFPALERALLSPVVRALRQAAGAGRATVGSESAVLQLAPAGARGAWRELGREEAEQEAEDEEEEEEEEEEGEESGGGGGDGAAGAPPQTSGRPRKVTGAYVLSRDQLPSFVDSEWPFESGRGVLSSAATMHRAAERRMRRRRRQRRQRRGRGHGPSGRERASANDDDDQHRERRRWARERDRSAALLAPHVLHFVTYVPPPGQRPLLVEGAFAAAAAAAAAGRRAAGGGGRRRNGTGAPPSVLDGVDLAVNGYWIPSWGGVLVWNPPHTAAENSSSSSSIGGSSSGGGGGGLSGGGGLGGGGGGGGRGGSGGGGLGGSGGGGKRGPRGVCALPDDASAAAARAFVTHLRALLGLPRHGVLATEPGALVAAVRRLPSPERGLGAWESDALARARARVGLLSAASTLRGLSDVVSELPNLGMPPLIGAQVGAALAAADAALEACARGDYETAAVAGAAAASAADAAYLHPSVLSQLNFPDSHKLGVYMPYFLPASVPLVQGLAREARRVWRRRRRRRQHVAAAAAAAAAAGAAVVGGAAAAAAAIAKGSEEEPAAPAATQTRRSKRA